MKQAVLVVDDDLATIRLVQSVLEPEGYSVRAETDGVNALNTIKENAPDLIILDIMMPKLDGFHVCRLLKYDETFKSIPVIILSARKSEEDFKLGEDVKADAYLTKPFEAKDLLGTVAKFLSPE